ncbi:MAG: LysR family transcriptional regulator [Bacteroidetes bacterium]|nr:LysR family transcriptional regulator [Bacteroidota bacterium]
MNLQQLEYIIAVDNYRHFLRASQACNVTQATLSMMIKKLEEELNEVIFDRSKQPVVPTAVGEKIIAQARRILSEAKYLKEMLQLEKGEISGTLKVGIIPTIAPYLLPLFLRKLGQDYPKLSLSIYEFTTDTLVQKLKSGELDVGILSTPLHTKAIHETVLYYEKYFLYVNENEPQYNKKYILPEHIDLNKLWLLEEGHCLRNQILNLCELKKQSHSKHAVHYEAGSIETLINLVDNNYGLTIIPELAAQKLSKKQQHQIKSFRGPVPVREISLVTHQPYVKERLTGILKEAILACIPRSMQQKANALVLEN